MKIRSGFVSNSSSSSFIVIGDSVNWHEVKELELFEGDLVVDGDFGKCEFGWEQEQRYDVESKIIWCYIQAKSIDKQEWINMLEEAIRSRNPEISNIRWELCVEWEERMEGGSEYADAYIDHQSSVSGGGGNAEMFDSMDALERFLFSGDSFIETDNDNH